MLIPKWFIEESKKEKKNFIKKERKKSITVLLLLLLLHFGCSPLPSARLISCYVCVCVFGYVLKSLHTLFSVIQVVIIRADTLEHCSS